VTDWTLDAAVRQAAINFVLDRIRVHGDDLPYHELRDGFTFRGHQVHLLGPQGIFKPRLLDYPLTISTAPPQVGKRAPYDDVWNRDGFLEYRYRGTDPRHPDNVGLAAAMQRKLPLIYFHGLTPGHYLAVCPAYVVGDDRNALTFTVAADTFDAIRVEDALEVTARRRYTTRLVRQRLHQADFRLRVLAAYRQQCAMCRLRHLELLDAAHIMGDTDPLGDPAVSNGLALCKLHHAAFDNQIVGIRPDLVIEVRRDILDERDGPMLLHGLQGMSGRLITVPRRQDWKPQTALLEQRYEAFRSAS
jgi:putative restriction endonuclease